MKRKTQTARIIESTDQANAKLDYQIKRVFACKPILSRILKATVEECKDMKPEEIEACIENPMISCIPIDYPEIISGQNVEDYNERGNSTKYDIRTFLCFPNKEPWLAKILIDVEAQKDENPSYDIPERGIFYCGRMLSAQLGTEFSNSEKDKKKYRNIKKVYSIWICSETSQKRANTIKRYKLNEEVLYGKSVDNVRYDLMNVVVVNISKTHNYKGVDNEFLKMMTDLLDETMSSKKKLEQLESYGVPVTEEIKKEVSNMCTYTTTVYQKGETNGIKKGVQKGKLDTIIELYENGMSIKDLSTYLKMSVDQIEEIIAAIPKNN